MGFFAGLKAHKEQNDVDNTNKEANLRDKAMELIRKVEEGIAKLLRTETNETNRDGGPYDGIKNKSRQADQPENNDDFSDIAWQAYEDSLKQGIRLKRSSTESHSR